MFIFQLQIHMGSVRQLLMDNRIIVIDNSQEILLNAIDRMPCKTINMVITI